MVREQDALDAIRAALSTQPSPGGQGDAITLAAEAIDDLHEEMTGARIGDEVSRQFAEVALRASRQSVGEPEIWVSPGQLEELKRRPAGQGSNYLPTRLASEGNFTQPLYAAPPAQAVDLGEERMFYIQDTRQFVGNCPMWWGPNGSGYVTRLDEAGRYTEQEAVKQNRCRETDIPWPCAEIEAIARRTVDFQHMRPRAERLAELALIDSQAVGNG